ncbi:MAG: hypothetical protein N3G21_11545 [Candidatus Hydrogenedentes bacterium]|nr:hypothetical protein [Candidatus Hydrogenedentota bacterium]
MRRCSLCNETIEETEFEFEEAIEVDGEYWHVGCYEEYFGETPEVSTYSSSANSYNSFKQTQSPSYQKNQKHSQK